MITVQREITLPKNTPMTSFLRYEVPVARAVVKTIKVVFPPGSAGFMGIRLRQGESQIVPASLGMWLTGDDITYPYEVKVDLTGTNGTLTFEGYNEDVMYDHMVILIFECEYRLESIEESLYNLIATNMDAKLSDILVKLDQVNVTMEAVLTQLGEVVKELYKLRSTIEEQGKERPYRELTLEELIRI
jgi:hypothetical protein